MKQHVSDGDILRMLADTLQMGEMTSTYLPNRLRFMAQRLEWLDRMEQEVRDEQ